MVLQSETEDSLTRGTNMAKHLDSSEEVAHERDLFEERVFNKYFISTIKVNPNPIGMRFINEPGIMDKVTFCRRDEKGNYVEEGLEPAWWAWQECAKRLQPAAEDKRIL